MPNIIQKNDVKTIINIQKTDELNLSDNLKYILEAGISSASKKAYRSDMAIFFDWLDNHTNSEKELPISERTIAEYIAYMSEYKSVATITRYVSTISKAHKIANLENPTTGELVRETMRGLRRTKGLSQKKAFALRGQKLMEILNSMSKTEWTSRRNRAILSIGWAAAMRTSEICALNIDDIEISDGGIIVNIRKSKTDQSSIGYRIGIPQSPLSLIIENWILSLKKLYGDIIGPLFPLLGCALTEKWFPRIGKRKRLSKRGLSKIVKKILINHGIEGSVHSLRRGLLTEAAALNVPELIIQRHSRHRSISALRGYIETGNIMIDNPLPTIFSSLFGNI